MVHREKAGGERRENKGYSGHGVGSAPSSSPSYLGHRSQLDVSV